MVTVFSLMLIFIAQAEPAHHIADFESLDKCQAALSRLSDQRRANNLFCFETVKVPVQINTGGAE